MLDRIIRMSVNNRLAVVIVAGVLMLVGMVVTFRADVDIFPDLNAPTVTVMTEAPGFTPEEVENSITFPIESALNGATGMRRISSSSAYGFSVVKAEFEWGTNDLTARQLIAEKLSAVAGELPSGAMAPVLAPQTSILGEIMLLGLTSDTISRMELRDIAERTVAPRLRAIPGVAQVSVMGGAEMQYVVTLSPGKMQRMGLTLDEVVSNIEAINRNIPGGDITDYGRSYTIKAEVNTTSVEELGETVAGMVDGKPVLLADIATIEPAEMLPMLGAASVNRQSGVLLTVVKQHGASTQKITEAVDEQVHHTLESYGPAIAVNTHLFRQNEFISSSVNNLQVSLFEGAIFVIAVLFIFLMNVRTTVISIVALPVSVIITLLVLALFGISINTMTLGGIAIAIGSLVDDAIVDVENVYRRLRENAQRPEAERISPADVVKKASAEVRLPILNSSLIIIASFMPLFFLDGMEGRMLIPLGIAFITALIASTLVALTLTPALCVYLLGTRASRLSDTAEPALTRKMRRLYERLLEGSFKYKKAILAGVGIAFVGVMVIFFGLGRNFLPPFNEGSLTINITAPAGTSLQQSEEIGDMAEQIMLSHSAVRSTARKTGRAELDEHSRGLNASEIEVAFHPETSTAMRNRVTDSLRHELSHILGCMVEVGQPISHRLNAMLSGSEGQIAVKISGPDLNMLDHIGKQVKTIMSQTPGLVDISLPPVSESPRIAIAPRRGMLAAYGVTPSQFSQWVDAALNGIKVGDVRRNGFSYDIVARYGDLHNTEMQLDYLRDMPVDTRNGKVPLSMLADITSTMGPSSITRENISRQIVAGANVSSRDLSDAIADLKNDISAKVTLPDGYFIDYGGMFESEQRASRTLALASLGALLLIFVILFNEFHSVGETFIILVNIPLAMIGGVLLLWLTFGQLNIPAIIGFISLMGITTRNGMLLISRYNKLKAEGVGLDERIHQGSSERLLPIIMTALTSALALIPLALRSQEPGNEIQSPMAIVILGGLLTSTFLNIFVVPILYKISKFKK